MKPDYQVVCEVLPIAIVIVLVNSLVFYLFAKCKSLRTSTNCLLLSLSVCDFMTGFVAIPLFLTLVMRVMKPPASVNFGFFVLIFNNVLVISASYHILAITLERYFLIVKPFTHRRLSKKSMFKVALAVWFVSAVIASMPYTWFSKKLTDRYKKIQFGYITFCLTFVFLVPCILIMVSQFTMFRTIAKRGRCALSVRGGTNQRNVRQEKKCLLVFALMAFMYAACWLPWFVLSLWFSFWFPLSDETFAVLDYLSKVFAIFRFVTSAANPVLYTFFKRDFLDAFKKLVLKKELPTVFNYTFKHVNNQTKTLICKLDAYLDRTEDLEYETVL